MKKKKTVVFAPILEEEKPKPVVIKNNILEDAILILNPLYLEMMNDAHSFLEELGFTIIDRDKITITSKQSNDIFKRRFKPSKYWDEIIDHFSAANTAFFHVTKLSANQYIDDLLNKYFTKWPDVLEFNLLERPLKEESFVYLFIPMDSPQMYETSLQLVWPEAVKFWGQDIVKFSHIARERTLNRIIQSTIGDSIKRDPKTADMMIKLFFNNISESKSVHFVTTTPKQGMFEVRVQNKYGSLDSEDKISKKRAQLLDKFHSLSMYYKKLWNLSDDFWPSFYRFRVWPDSSYKLHRVFEIEEYTEEQ